MEVDDLIDELFKSKKPVGTLDRDEVKDIIKKVIEDAAKAKGIKYTFQDMGFFVPIVFTATDQILSLIPQGKVIVEGNVDEICRGVGKWSAYKSTDKKYQIIIKEI